ncbi:MAG TPA: YkgJ family cysteine cluster protein [Bacteroidales bacterium]|nr:YkgJ family cysteine cluster protein [Bacteroidales bacterium]
MTVRTKLDIHDKLPLTCSRTGTCCHGKLVLLNPWELAFIAKEKKITTREFRDQYCDYGGIRLHFNGKAGWKGQPACSQYIENFGCSVHSGRPLSCRLFPLGRQIQSGNVHYMYEGTAFPCLDGCPEVTGLPHLTVEEYLSGQETAMFEKAQDEYLEVMQNLADIAFVLFLDSGLSASGEKETLRQWRKLGNTLPETLVDFIGADWIDRLTLPEINDLESPGLFAARHNDLLQTKAQDQFGAIQTYQELHEASVLMMAVALQMARALGANPKDMAEHWIETAKQNGGLE